jgi:hypothetical protein
VRTSFVLLIALPGIFQMIVEALQRLWALSPYVSDGTSSDYGRIV